MSRSAGPPPPPAPPSAKTSEQAPGQAPEVPPPLPDEAPGTVVPAGAPPPAGPPTLWSRLRRIFIGGPRDLADKTLFHTLSLIPVLAWVGLGADGLSSSSYGPEETFRALRGHTYLAPGLAALTAITVFVIAGAYSRMIERFPTAGGYGVATKLLGPKVGVVAGGALVIDYVLTITVSIASCGDSIFSFLPPSWQPLKLAFEIAVIAGLTMINLRGVRESVMVLAPIFVLFLVTHVVLLGGALLWNPGRWSAATASAVDQASTGLQTLGLGGMLLLFLHAYSLGGGTYTGIESVSNGLPIMREPRVQTAQRTMVYIALSLAGVAAGLLLSYLLLDVRPTPGKTMNAVLLETLAGDSAPGKAFVVVTLLSEGALLIVGALSGFIGGPRVMANMAVDSWLPRRLAALSDRLTTQNGVLLMGAASLVALFYSQGDIHLLVVMYSINVFVTFTLSMFGMFVRLFGAGRQDKDRLRQGLLFGLGFLLCVTILGVTVYEQFAAGGWVTLAVTGGLVALCFVIRGHYRTVNTRLARLDQTLANLPLAEERQVGELMPARPTAAILVSSFGGLGIHTVLNIFRSFAGYFQNVVFMSIGVVDSGEFKGEAELAALRRRTEENLARYVDFARKLGLPAKALSALGTDAVEEAEKLCVQVAREFPRSTFFAGQVIFQRERWYDRWLHNQTAYAVQKRLQWQGMTMVILPVRVR